MTTSGLLPVGLQEISTQRVDQDYDTDRTNLLWNRRTPDRFPHTIVHARNVEDVRQAVRYAAENKLLVSSMSSGHSYIGSSLRDDAVLIDVSALKSIDIDVANNRAVVQPGVNGPLLAKSLSPHGLAFPVGHCSGPAMGGYLLGGGFGLNWSDWGMACTLVRGFDMVTADGSVLSVDQESDPDRMWLARGCGPSFPGVVVSYELELKPLPAVATSLYVFPVENANDVGVWIDETLTKIRSSVEVCVLIAGGPMLGKALNFDAESTSYLAVWAAAYETGAAEAELALRPFREYPTQLRPVFGVHAERWQFDELFAVFDQFLPDGQRVHCDTAWTDEGIASTFAPLDSFVETSPSVGNHVLFFSTTPRQLPDTNFSMLRQTGVTIYAVNEDPQTDDRNASWVRDGIRRLEPITVGHWLGEADLTAHPSRSRKSFSAENWSRARALRHKFDPDGRFADYILLEN